MSPCAAAASVSFPARPAASAAAASSSSARARAGVVRAAAGGGEGGSGKWWAPLLGWSGQPDYIDAQPAAAAAEEAAAQHQRTARRFGVLTEDKARQLRLRMMETESFHDAMYHSAIASRLARSA